MRFTTLVYKDGVKIKSSFRKFKSGNLCYDGHLKTSAWNSKTLSRKDKNETTLKNSSVLQYKICLHKKLENSISVPKINIKIYTSYSN